MITVIMMIEMMEKKDKTRSFGEEQGPTACGSNRSFWLSLTSPLAAVG